MPAVRRQQKIKCSYHEGKRRCPYDAAPSNSIEPPLCRAHQLAVAEAAKPKSPGDILSEILFDLMNGEAIDRDAAINAAKQVFGEWRARQAAAAGAPRPPPPGWRPPGFWGAQQPPPPPPPHQQVDPDVRARQMARRIMGFGPTEPLTADMIRKRKRTLAERYHPDRGGSTERMAAINDAADILMRML